MRQNKGYIRLHRNIVDWCWYKNANTFRVFIHLLLNANTRPYRFENIIINRGEIATSYQRIGLAIDMSYAAVRTAISHLRNTGTLTVKKYPKFLVITVLNYDAYQSDSQADQQSLDSQKSQKNEIVPNLSNENDNQNDSQKIGGKAYIKGDNNGYQNLKRQSIQQSNDSRLTVKSQADDNNIKIIKNNKNKKEYIALSGEPEFDVDRFNF